MAGDRRGCRGLGLGAAALLHLGRNLLRYVDRLAPPAALVFGVAVALSRIASDGEARALRACGVGLASLVAPVLALAGGLPPSAAPWLPNAGFALAGIALCWRADRLPG